MTLVDLADDSFVAAAPERVADRLRDPAFWSFCWPRLELSAYHDRGTEGLRWYVAGALVGVAEFWLEPYRDGTLVHVFLRAEPPGGRTAGTPSRRRVERLRRSYARPLKRALFALKYELEAGRPPGVPAGVPGRSSPTGTEFRALPMRSVGGLGHTERTPYVGVPKGESAMTVLLTIGTGKGLFLATSEDRRDWSVSGPHFPMTALYAVGIDTRRQPPRILAGVTNPHFGPSVATSDDLGETWNEPESAPIAFPADTEESLERVWQLAPGPVDDPDVVYAGVEPSALFRSGDGGQTFEMVRGLWDHPHRPQWEPGGGGKAIHTVLPHPTDSQQMLIAMSAGGVYRTSDGGKSWEAANSGIRVTFLPDEYPEFGQCVHKVAGHADRPDQFFAQVHHGVYRSDDSGSSWTSIAEGLPTDFGFAMISHPHRPGVIYNFPIAADGRRFPPEERCRVYRSEDAGSTWTPLSTGLPEEPFYASVLRDAMCCDDADQTGVYFGSRNGEVYASPDEGDSWHQVAAHLPDVLCVRAAVVG